MAAVMILPGTGRGPAARSVGVEGALHQRCTWARAPSTVFDGPPSRTGEDL